MKKIKKGVDTFEKAVIIRFAVTKRQAATHGEMAELVEGARLEIV